MFRGFANWGTGYFLSILTKSELKFLSDKHTSHIELPSNVDRNQSLSEKNAWRKKKKYEDLLLKSYDLTYECVIDEQLQEMENDKNWKECIQVNVKAEPPLNILKKNPMMRFFVETFINHDWIGPDPCEQVSAGRCCSPTRAGWLEPGQPPPSKIKMVQIGKLGEWCNRYQDDKCHMVPWYQGEQESDEERLWRQ